MTVENAYRDYCKQPYHLHAILVHDGSAESGHYYSFIFDQKQKRWWRFNDHSVSMELEDVVMREAVGGQQDSNKAAYMLIYANQFVVSKAQALSLNVPKPLKMQIEQSNAAFLLQRTKSAGIKTSQLI